MSRISVYTSNGWVVLGDIEDSIADQCAQEYAILMNQPVACEKL